MLKKILAVVAALIIVPVVGVVGVAATKPDSFLIQRSTVIQAPPERIQALVTDFHRWPAWSPFEKVDPQMKRTYAGAERGVGAIYTWEGNDHAGAGRMEITEVTPEAIKIKLEFTKPMAASNMAEYYFEPEAGGTKVTWAMKGDSPFLNKVMDTCFNMDKMVGQEFETGLASMKAIAEKGDKVSASH